VAGLQRRSMSDDKPDGTIKAPVGIRHHKTERLSIVSESVCAEPPQRKEADPEKNQGTRLCPDPRHTRSAARRRDTRAMSTPTNSRAAASQPSRAYFTLPLPQETCACISSGRRARKHSVHTQQLRVRRCAHSELEGGGRAGPRTNF
jgi:hypothetical protein